MTTVNPHTTRPSNTICGYMRLIEGCTAQLAEQKVLCNDSYLTATGPTTQSQTNPIHEGY
ncbi:hypothetical protein HDF16_003557 [Granulicella aggregans]|uniref:Uncharacterized protein n=1 Tax=Granulicella aggregans TaxID=474949 RepID=A0A7W8E522_9BACT|nr:hypothetical protein [Granulicella aggregans]